MNAKDGAPPKGAVWPWQKAADDFAAGMQQLQMQMQHVSGSVREVQRATEGAARAASGYLLGERARNIIFGTAHKK